MAAVKHKLSSAPQNLREVSVLLFEIGGEQREIERVKADLNDEIEFLKSRAESAIKKHKNKISRLVSGLFIFAESRRNELTDKNKRKTIQLSAGAFGWRMTPPSVSIRNAKLVLAKFKELGLERFIRVKEEPDKEAMLKEPEAAKTVKGVSIRQREEFFVKPTETDLEVPLILKVRKAKNQKAD